jgi:hypothetical protein
MTGMLRAFGSQEPCILTANGTVPNEDRITQYSNMLVLDHVCALPLCIRLILPIQPFGTGFSYGRMVNNSRDSALDAYDFLLKYFVVLPHLTKSHSRLIISPQETSSSCRVAHMVRLLPTTPFIPFRYIPNTLRQSYRSEMP